MGAVLSALSSKSVDVKDAPKVILKEALSGVMAGSILSLIVAPTAHFVMGISKHVSIVSSMHLSTFLFEILDYFEDRDWYLQYITFSLPKPESLLLANSLEHFPPYAV